MDILTISTLKGPNFWSNYRKNLVVLKIDLKEYEYKPTNLLEGFSERLKNLIPSLKSHYCSPGHEGGLYARLEEGTWLGHVIEHVALELQSLAGMDCGFGRTFTSEIEGIYDIIFSYQIEKAGLYAAKAAFRLIKTLAQNEPYHLLEKDIATLKEIHAAERLGPSTQAIVDEARRRHIPVSIESSSLVTLGYGYKQKKIWSTVSSDTSSIAVDIAANKGLTKKILADHYIPVPKGVLISSVEELETIEERVQFPLVVKPLNGNHGRGITTYIKTKEKLIEAFHHAKEISHDIIVEHFVEGDDYRILVVNFKVVAVAKRTPAMIVGTGSHSIEELIHLVNQDHKRGDEHENVLTKIKVDSITESILKEQQLDLSDILPKGQVLYLKNTANISTGGTATDVTEEIHPANALLAERIAHLVGLDICGIDVISKDISKEMTTKNSAVLEVNAGPGLRMHLSPTQGTPRNVAEPIVEMLFPDEQQATIPIIGVTGTNGKTTVVRLIANMLHKAKHRVGFTTTEGIYINGTLIYEGDCSGPQSAQTVLKNPQVEVAVLECARGGILRSGLGFDECDMSIITNVSSDHLGLNDIHTLEDLARVKAVLAFSTKKEGHALLNAEDDLVFALKKELKCQVALFSSTKNERVIEHCQQGGLAAYIENHQLIIQQGKEMQMIVDVREVPITFNGKASAMIQNMLAACLAGFIMNLSSSSLKSFLTQFHATPETLPGRMNLFDFPQCKVMIDYAHNEGAFNELNKFLKVINRKKVGIIAAVGDRRDEDIQNVGLLAACAFDEIIIRHDKDGRGRNNEELTHLLIQGIKQSPKQPRILIISDELEAIEYAVASASSDSFIFYSTEDVFKALAYLKKLHKMHLSLEKVSI